MKMLVTGIKGFDASIGGIQEGTRTMLIGPSGSGKTVFSMQFIWAGLQNSEKVSYNVFDRPFSSLAGYFRSFCWDIVPYIEKDFFVPIQSFPHFDEYPRDPSVEYFELTNLDAMKRIDLELSEKGVTRLACGDISQVVFSLFPPEQMSRMEGWSANWIGFDRITVLDVIATGYLDEAGRKNFDLNKKGAQNIIHFRIDNGKREMRIEKMEGVSHPLKWVPFTITDKGIEMEL